METTMTHSVAQTITFTINNHDLPDPVRRVELDGETTTANHVPQLVENGYVVRERLITGEHLERLGACGGG